MKLIKYILCLIVTAIPGKMLIANNLDNNKSLDINQPLPTSQVNENDDFFDNFEDYPEDILLPLVSNNQWLQENILVLNGIDRNGATVTKMQRGLYYAIEGSQSLETKSSGARAIVGHKINKIDKGILDLFFLTDNISPTLIQLTNGNQVIFTIEFKFFGAIYINEELISATYTPRVWNNLIIYFDSITKKINAYLLINDTPMCLTSNNGVNYLANSNINGLKIGNNSLSGTSYFDAVKVTSGYNSLPTYNPATSANNSPYFVTSKFETNYKTMNIEFLLAINRLDSRIDYLVVEDPNYIEGISEPDLSVEEVLSGTVKSNQTLLSRGYYTSAYVESTLNISDYANKNILLYLVASNQFGSSLIVKNFNIAVNIINSFDSLINAFSQGTSYEGMFVLENDIDCGWQTIAPFSGTFRGVFIGNGHKIKNLRINGAGAALFAKAKMASFSDLILEQIHSQGNSSSEAILLSVSEGDISMENISIRNCTVNQATTTIGELAAQYTGTLLARHSTGDNLYFNNISVTNCTVYSYKYGSLVIGHIEKGINHIFNNIYVSGTLYVSDETAGGILGRMKTSSEVSITNVVSEISIYGKNRQSAILSKQEGGALRIENAYVNAIQFSTFAGGNITASTATTAVGGQSGDSTLLINNIYTTNSTFSTVNTGSTGPGLTTDYIIDHTVINASMINENWLGANLSTFDLNIWEIKNNTIILKNAK